MSFSLALRTALHAQNSIIVIDAETWREGRANHIAGGAAQTAFSDKIDLRRIL
jgi:hypothetical protein